MVLFYMRKHLVTMKLLMMRNRQMNIETKDRLAETNIIVVENGFTSYYEYPVRKKK